VTLAFLLSLVAVGPAAVANGPDLVGSWVLDHALSAEGPPRGGPGALLPSSSSGTGPSPAAALAEFVAAPESLEFGRDPDGTLTLDDGERLTRLYTDGRRFKRANGLLETRCRIKDGVLELESRPPGSDLKVSVAYSLDAQRRLLVDATLKPPRGKALRRRRVYNRE
jgi:hypothetical protein